MAKGRREERKELWPPSSPALAPLAQPPWGCQGWRVPGGWAAMPEHGLWGKPRVRQASEFACRGRKGPHPTAPLPPASQEASRCPRLVQELGPLRCLHSGGG